MPAPILPSQICETVPSTNASFCRKIKLVFLQFPNYVCQIISYIFDADGTVSDAFKSEANYLKPGDIKITFSETPDMGFLYLNGQAVLRESYPALFEKYGTFFGAGDGSTTFNLPDARGKFILGASSSHAKGTSGGAEEVTLDATQLPPHTHQVGVRNRTDLCDGCGSHAYNQSQGGAVSITTGSAGGGQPHPNMPPYITFCFHVKY